VIFIGILTRHDVRTKCEPAEAENKMSNTVKKYERFTELAKELADLDHAQGLLSWDQEVCMPPKGTASRARALGTLAGVGHERLTDPELIEIVAELTVDGLQGDQAVNVRQLRRDQDRAVCLPKSLVVEMTETASLAHEAWVEAREKSDFTTFQPWLQKLVDLKLREAEAVGYEGSVYNALFDEYEPFSTVETLEPLLTELRARLVPLVEAIRTSGRADVDLLDGQKFDVGTQAAFGRQVMAELGFDLQAGRLDVSVHPFCSGTSPDDVRLTTRYSPAELTSSLFGVIHETGHGLYEQGLPVVEGMPVGSAISLGIHESQSRMWENMVGRSREFWVHYLPKLVTHFPRLASLSVDQIYAAVNRVQASLIRVEADEVTYNLHILLRFELEKALMEGELSVADLPGEWNARMESYLGIRPSNDTEGVLQDVHWSFGGIGYFPTYTLGNLYGAQFYHQACADLGDLPAQIASGDLSKLLTWLRENIHSVGQRRTAGELIEDVTGEPLRVDYLMEYLEGKFKPLYGLS